MNRFSPAVGILAMLLLQACGGVSAPPSAVAAKPAGPSAGPAQARWDALVAAAKKEGKLDVIIPPGDLDKKTFEAFQADYGISVDTMVGNGNADIVPKVDAERKAGQYNWDVVAHSPGMQFTGLRPIGALEPLKPALILPEVLDDASWFDGFEAGWADTDKMYVYQFVGFQQPVAKVDRRLVSESQLNKIEQLWDPAWKGQIAMQDPRVPSAGVQAGTVLLLAKGEDKFRQLLQAQQPVVTQDRRQLGEWIVRGQYHVGIGVAPDSLTPLALQGVDVKSVVALDTADPGGAYYTAGTGALALISKPPHPNAAKLFVNWLLSREGQSVYAQSAKYDSRRKDVPPGDPDTVPQEGRNYYRLDLEENYAKRNATIAIAKQVLSGR